MVLTTRYIQSLIMFFGAIVMVVNLLALRYFLGDFKETYNIIPKLFTGTKPDGRRVNQKAVSFFNQDGSKINVDEKIEDNDIGDILSLQEMHGKAKPKSEGNMLNNSSNKLTLLRKILDEATMTKYAIKAMTKKTTTARPTTQIAKTTNTSSTTKTTIKLATKTTTTTNSLSDETTKITEDSKTTTANLNKKAATTTPATNTANTTATKTILSTETWSSRLQQQQQQEHQFQPPQKQQQQQCKLPNLDPFHPDIRKYIKDDWSSKAKCGIRRKAKILTGGRLHLKLKNVQRAGFYYIQRVNDFDVMLSKWHPLKHDLKNTTFATGLTGCLRLFQENRAVIPRPGDSFSTTRDNKLGHCPKSRVMTFTEDGRIIHTASNEFLTFINGSLTFTSSRALSSDRNSKFKVQPSGTIKHVKSQRCIHKKNLKDTLLLDKCDVYTSRFFIDTPQGNETITTDINVTIPLDEDFIVIDIIQNQMSSSEFHMYPVRQGSAHIKQRKSSGRQQLNIIMLMSDSISRSDAQRYLKETYGTLENDPDSFIFKGHTINGDGTTPQLCTMLVGKQEHELPEARRGYPNSKPLDRWNFIFKDFRERGYVTLFSEDEAWVNAFHYRLHGFKDPPADKYARPWWIAVARYIWENSRGSVSCAFELGLAYVKDFLKEYKDTPTFSYTISSALTHSEPARIGLVDSDIKAFFRSLKETGYLNNSIVMFHGDHGNRLSPFRTSIQGKLEERLPFVSITVPPWFKTAYPSFYRNLGANSKVLTTYYDIYATFKNILGGLDEKPSSHKYGSTLFSDIAKLNRTCAQAGIDEHWCPCLTYKSVDVLDSIVQIVAGKMVDSINDRLSKYNSSKEMCSRLRVDRVLRASKRLPNSKVQQYEKTLRSSLCDNCDVMLNSNYTAADVKYEVVFKVLPSKAVFEASGEFNKDTKRITLNDNVSRLNVYGNEPECIARELPYLRPFCFCKSAPNRT